MSISTLVKSPAPKPVLLASTGRSRALVKVARTNRTKAVLAALQLVALRRPFVVQESS
jgi:hypothetical protein